MQKVRLLLTLSLVSTLLAGCMTAPAVLSGDCFNKTLPLLLDSTNLKSLFHDIALEICSDKGASCGVKTNNAQADVKSLERSCVDKSGTNQTTVLVTDFADLQTFLPNQSGLLMGELMRGSLNNVCEYKIVQAEFAKYFKLSEKGLVVLTRQASEIKKDEYSQPEVIVGTYNYLNNNKVLLFVRKIDTQTGKISKIVTKELNYTCSGRSVLGYTSK